MNNNNSEALSTTQDRRDVIDTLSTFSPELVGIISECAIEKVYNRDVLANQMKEVIAVVSLISLGSDRLKGHFESALQEGLTLEQLKEIVTLSTIYLGFPRAIDAMLKLNEVAEDLKLVRD